MSVAQEELEAVFPLRPEDPVLGFPAAPKLWAK